MQRRNSLSLLERVRRSLFLRGLLALWIAAGLFVHVLFYTWPITARFIPDMMERLRFPSAVLFALYIVLLDVPHLGVYYRLRHRQRRDPLRNNKFDSPSYTRRLWVSLCCDLYAAFLLFSVTTEMILREPMWQVSIIVLSVIQMSADIILIFSLAKRSKY